MSQIENPHIMGKAGEDPFQEFNDELKLIENSNKNILADRPLSDFCAIFITEQGLNIRFTEELQPEIKKEVLNLFIKYYSK